MNPINSKHYQNSVNQTISQKNKEYVGPRKWDNYNPKNTVLAGLVVPKAPKSPRKNQPIAGKILPPPRKEKSTLDIAAKVALITAGIATAITATTLSVIALIKTFKK